MTLPQVSAIVAVKNGERYLAQALESILSQDYPPLEVIVVDGGSSDESVKIAESYPKVRCINQRGEKGFADAWNQGIAVARGDLIAILDSDDWWTPGKLKAQVELLIAQPELDYSITRIRFALEEGKPCPPGFKPELLKTDHIAYMPSALLARKTMFEAMQGFKTDWAISSDIDWFARAKDMNFKLGIVPEVMLYKRVHDANLSYLDARTNHFNREIVGLLKQSLDRQRANRSKGDKQ
ncbi:putative glycosyltransferase EpsH [Abditibacteriota bacterium]|nr:putative glycosyltransferase EpsH [Abditibacteriota bacterium]